MQHWSDPHFALLLWRSSDENVQSNSRDHSGGSLHRIARGRRGRATARSGQAGARDLRCEYLVNPLGIGVAEPRLSWTAPIRRRGQVQTAYRILVASDPELLSDGRGDLWDSGKVISNRSIQIVYGAGRSTSQMRCYWKVRVWDGDG